MVKPRANKVDEDVVEVVVARRTEVQVLGISVCDKIPVQDGNGIEPRIKVSVRIVRIVVDLVLNDHHLYEANVFDLANAGTIEVDEVRNFRV